MPWFFKWWAYLAVLATGWAMISLALRGHNRHLPWLTRLFKLSGVVVSLLALGLVLWHWLPRLSH